MSDLNAGFASRPVGVLERLVSWSSRRLVRWASPFTARTQGATAAAPSIEAEAEASRVRSVDLRALTPADAPRSSVGAVDSVLELGNQLVISGWLLTSDQGPIDAMQVTCAGQRVADTGVHIKLPSAAIALHLGGQPGSGAANARYRVELPIPATGTGRPQGALITLLPFAGGRALRPVVVAHDTAIPKPTDDLALRIGGGFLDVALEFMGYFQQLARLSPGDKVLEVGCGLGRMAYPLAYYLDDGGSYLGFDIDAELIGWANDSIGAARDNFRFEHADVHNQHYNPAGTLSPESFRFPAASEAIDVSLAVSLFTHLPALVARHYLHETARVLRDGGTALLTAFLVDDAARRGMAEGRAILQLGERAAGGWVADAANPEFAIGFPAADFLGWMAEAGLEVIAVYPGNWSGRAPFLSFQDIVIARHSFRTRWA